ncbi:hypothetical protein J7L67_10070, partial [bacterium]|nr:hypothetical protein [bacterium]
MQQNKSLFEIFDEIIAKDSRYEIEAYNFLLLAFNYTVSKTTQYRHVTGQELLQSIKEYALDQYGPMTRIVLQHWGITTTEDLGHIVFNLVDAGLIGKNDDDSINDFINVFDFSEVFDNPF